MSTLAVIATSTLTGVIGAAAMYVPARLALRDAQQYRDEADRTFNAAESLADEVERTRNLPWHYAAIDAAPEDKPVIGEVLHVEPHETGEHPVVACCDGHDVEPCDPATYAVPCCGDCPDWAARKLALSDDAGHDDEDPHTDACPDLYYCPTSGEVESGCHGGFDVCCYAPELHVPVDDEDAPADDTDRPGLHLVLLAIPVALWDRLCEWWQSLWAARRERHMVGSGEQATDGDPFAELLAHVEDGDVEERQVEIEAWIAANPPTPYRGRHWAAGTEHTDLFPIVVPAQRDGGDDL